jgi:hypothetical protein
LSGSPSFGLIGGVRGYFDNIRRIVVVKHYIIERQIPGIHTFDQSSLRKGAGESNAALDEMAGRARWLQSFVLADRTLCSYLADDEAAIREHALLSGFPASQIFEVVGVIGPETASG